MRKSRGKFRSRYNRFIRRRSNRGGRRRVRSANRSPRPGKIGFRL